MISSHATRTATRGAKVAGAAEATASRDGSISALDVPCLETKPDMAAAARHWDTFWRGENSRPAVSAVVEKPNVTPVEHPGWYVVRPDVDPNPAIDRLLAWSETHAFIAEAIPHYYLEFGCDHFAALLGGDLKFTDGKSGGWAVQTVPDLASAEIRFDREGYWWRKTVEAAQALKERCEGRLMIAAPTLVSNLDTLAALHGSENLLMAMMDSPDILQRALRQVDEAHAEVWSALGELLEFDRWGSISRHGSYSLGRCHVGQCDFSCMIGTEMFREFAAPYIRNELGRFEGATYHLDGPDALRHLDEVCGMPELDMVQWQPGAGNAQTQDWTSVYQRIDELGKGQTRGGNSEQAVRVWRSLASRQVFFSLQVETRMEAEDCLAALEAATSEKPETDVQAKQDGTVFAST